MLTVNRTKPVNLCCSTLRIAMMALAATFLALFLSGIEAPVRASPADPQATPAAHTLEIRYTHPEASAVMLVWGINDWQTTPIEGQPEGTVANRGVMNTPMTLEDGLFVARLRLPAWSEVDYGFLVTKDLNGLSVQVWENDGGKDFQTTLAEKDMVVEAGGKASSEASAGGEQAGPLVNLDIRYISPTAGEVYLVWGINGWTLAPEAERPAGTIVKENTLHTPMLVEEQAYVSRLRVPAGTTLDFGFLTTKDSRGNPVKVWESNAGKDYQITLSEDKALEIQSQVKLETGRNLPSFLVVGLYVLIGLIVILVVGFVFARKSG